MPDKAEIRRDAGKGKGGKMKREGSLSSLTDGKIYRSSDMARLGCNDCEGCSACCRNMGNSVVLDPYDVWRLERGLEIPFAQMIGNQVMLSVVDGLILPSLNMETQTGACPFLNEKGRCSIHAFRPGICRLFPLGRYYHADEFSYVLMTGECKKQNRSKVKIEQWISEPNIKAYEQFVLSWKKILETAREASENLCHTEASSSINQEQEEELLAKQKQISLELLQKFYFSSYQSNFFEEFYNRCYNSPNL